jgi:DNA polymerase V
MYALVDANSFYASAEEVFDPTIRGKPVVVLTNNDGCICAMSASAKRLGIKSFSPYFQVKDLLHEAGAIIRSSNYALYADLSRRVFEVTGRYAQQHVYSVDEAFLKFSNQHLSSTAWFDIAQDIKHTVWLETRIPVGVGMANTPTLAKAASFAGKRFDKFNGIAVLDSPEQVHYVLSNMECGDVWGVGKRIAARLHKMGIYSALELAQYPPAQIRKAFSVELERTVRELNGTVCFSWNDVKADKQQVFASRSFGERVDKLEILNEAISFHAQRVGRKLRQQGSVTRKISVSAQSSPMQPNHYKRNVVRQFITPTNDDRKLVGAAISAMAEIYCEGVSFLKCSIGAIEIEPEAIMQCDLFSSNDKDSALMSCLDAINAKFGNHSLKVASQGISDKRWQMNRKYLSPEYTTKWSDIPKFTC